MSKRTRERAKDYELSDDGSYRYVGQMWRWAEPKEREPFLREGWVLLAVASVALVGTGFIPTVHVGGALYVMLPYALSLVGVALVGVALWRLTREGDALRNHVYESSVVHLEPKLLLAMLASFASAVGAAIQVVIGTGDKRLALLFCLLMVVSGLSLGQLLRRARSLTFTIVSR